MPRRLRLSRLVPVHEIRGRRRRRGGGDRRLGSGSVMSSATSRFAQRSDPVGCSVGNRERALQGKSHHSASLARVDHSRI